MTTAHPTQAETTHKLTKHRYLEEDGRDHMESRGLHTGWPTHFETLCGKRYKHKFKKQSDVYRSPKEASYRWSKVDCPDCLERGNL